MDILGFATKFNAGKHHSMKNDDVFIDRLNHRYTVTMILVFAAIVTTQQYFGSPITCWVPAQFTGGYEKYANDICWIMNTYYVPMEHDIPHAENTRYERTLKYYQWSPFILMFMALCFYFPRMIWRSLNNKSGLDIEKLVETAMRQEKKDEPKKTREQTVQEITNSIRGYIDNRYAKPDDSGRRSLQIRNVFYSLTFWRHRHLGSYLFILFTTVKFLFLFNSIAQMILLNAFLGNEYHLFGFEVISKFINGLDWGESRRFPRVTLCDFHIREVGIVHRYTVQCVLPINLFNEKIFLILWFWILLLTVFNIFDSLFWLVRIIAVKPRYSYIQRKLKMIPSTGTETADDRRLKEEFITEYLQSDGCFALRLLARNGHDLIVGDVIQQLYKSFHEKKRLKSHNADRPMNYSSSSNGHSMVSRRVPAQDDSTDHDNEKLLQVIESHP